MTPIRSPLHGQLVEWAVAPGASVRAGQLLLVIEAMKMEHEVHASADGMLIEVFAQPGDTVEADSLLGELAPASIGQTPAHTPAATPTLEASDPDTPRADLQRVLDRQASTLDAARPQVMARRHALGQLSARDIVGALTDPGSFNEYGAFAIAAQTRRRPQDELIAQTPADGLITGTATVNADLFGADQAGAAVLVYDATVLAGTQGMRNHQKSDRLLELAARERLPVLWWAEGGGGRPGDVDMPVVAGLHVGTFAAQARLSGLVPLVGMTSGRCFAGNAVLLGCCDVIIATRQSQIGMGGPAMIEGGGMGVYRPEDIGPSAVQHANGVIDLLADDDAHAVALGRRYLSYFQGRLAQWQTLGGQPDTRALRQVVPENRLRVYDTRAAPRCTASPMRAACWSCAPALA